MGEFLSHRMVFRIVDDDLRLPHLDRYGCEEYPLAYGEQFGVLKFRSLESPVPEGEHQVIGHSVQEDAQAVCVEAVAGETATKYRLCSGYNHFFYYFVIQELISLLWVEGHFWS